MKWLPLITASCVLALASPALAGDVAVVRGADGVHAVAGHRGGIVIVFSGSGRRFYRQLAGRRVSVDCEPAPGSVLAGITVGEDTIFTARRRGFKLELPRGLRGVDWCELSALRKGLMRPIVAVPVTDAGRTFLDERLRAVTVDGIITLAGVDAKDGHYPTTAEVVAKAHGHILALNTPSDPVPAGQYGFYSDGAQHIAAVTTTPSGRRLFEDIQGDTVSSNILPHLNSLNSLFRS
jgi:hypothetical protein